MVDVRRKTVRAVYEANNKHGGSGVDFDEWLRSELEKAYAWGAVDMQAECNGAGYAMNPFVKGLPNA